MDIPIPLLISRLCTNLAAEQCSSADLLDIQALSVSLKQTAHSILIGLNPVRYSLFSEESKTALAFPTSLPPGRLCTAEGTRGEGALH